MKLLEHIGGILAVILSVCFLMLLFWLGFKTPENEQKRTLNIASVEAKAVSADTLQKRLEDIANKKQAIEDARLAEIKRKEDLKKQALARKTAAEKKAAEKKAAEKKAAEKKAAEKKAAEKKAAEKKAAEKAAIEAKKLQSIQPVGDLSALSSYTEADALRDFGSKIQNNMKEHWQLPPNIPNNLSTKLLIKIDNKGNVISAKILRSSGYPLFDAAALEVVHKTSPLPLPKNTKALQLVLKEGLEINFSP